jgi:dihydrofolate reductase
VRKLILQMQTTVDGYVSAAQEGIRWQVWDWGPDWAWDRPLREYFNSVLDDVGTILLSRPMIEEGYLDHWRRTAVEHKGDPEYRFAQKITDAEKVVVTNGNISRKWEKTTVSYGDLSDAGTKLKQGDGDTIISFGGAGFAESLIANGLPDEIQLFVNPTAVGAGRSIFGSARNHGLQLGHIASQSYACGIVVNRYAVKSGPVHAY